MMRLGMVLAVARLEAGELWRDPQVAFLLAGAVALVHVLLLAAARLDPTGALAIVVGIGPLAILFLAGPRRGAAPEGAFRRLVMTCPVEPDEWFWGRALGLQSLACAYAALVAPALAVELSVARAPFWAGLNALAALAAFALFLTFLGLAFATTSSTRGAGLLALAALAILASTRAAGLARIVPDGAPRRLVAFGLALATPILVAVAADVRAPGAVPAWAIALGLVGALVAAGGWSARRHGARAPGRAALATAWIGGALVVALTISFDGGARGPATLADRAAAEGARFGLLVPLALLSGVPLAIGLARRWRVGREGA